MWSILQPRKSAFLLIVADLVAASLFLWLGTQLLFPERWIPENFESMLGTLPWIYIAVVCAALLMDLYHMEGSFSRYNVFISAMIASGLTVIVTGGASFFLRYFAFPRSVLLFLGATLAVYFYLSRYVVGEWHRRSVHSIKIITQKDVEQGLLRVTEREPVDMIVIQDFTDLNLRKLAIVEAVKEAATLRVEITPTDILLHGGQLISRDGRIYIEITPRTGQLQFIDVAKRGFDLLLATLALLLALPLMAIIACLIGWESGRPVMYIQERVTLQGKPFRIYKFRTMIQDAEKQTGPTLSSFGDPRVTRIGAFLRRWRLDELPQLFNVLKGEMSLVGPRPERPVFVREFEEEIPEYHLRHLIPPGITGMAQIYGRYSSSVEEKLIYDLYYSKRRGPLSDLILLIKTIKVVMQREKAG
ncbi:sugar transferase [Heliophilum fasciatum]|uniref:Lipopolysaccharide/colanic/teichoic acid biosynthesis glycosyltransferase n=1 Tax=Heliophilum fasciatum TaxID=35700 RepID=A0A4V2SWX8_9FIRM|nr:sugar transferase [Heliophilum fasciatum]MCW2279003.1 lipopolysaccharide/colanic/teichoic acid biosynthesis glycosyltransferase [Heliophilum fasciatum]TCP64046.1 lipopolysaccharide/colanic/teichoic acid biosynthesis glycosyltransferase [Heliophilum fasciatum]